MKIAFLLLGVMLSQYVSKKEAYHSPTAVRLNIQNVPTPSQEAVVVFAARNFFDPIRQRIGSPLYISSFFRSPALNKAVGGARNSDHMVLEDIAAFDIDQDGRSEITNGQVFEVIYEGEIDYYKLIWEFSGSSPPNLNDPTICSIGDHSPAWVHVSISTDPIKNKLRKTYVAQKVNNKTIYTVYGTS